MKFYVFPTPFISVRINTKESTSQIIVIEGISKGINDSKTYLSPAIDPENIDTKNKIKIDVANRLILEAETSYEEEIKDTEGKIWITTFKCTQNFSKINKNITVQIPDKVEAESMA